MKSLLSILVLAASTVCTTGALAAGPIIEPGPVQTADESSIEVVNAMLMANPTMLKKFISSGNQVKEITIQYTNPTTSVYRFTRQQCNRGGVAGGLCLGGSMLTVVVKEVRQGEHVSISATTDLVYLK